MNDRTAQLLMLLVVLILPVSALAARRLPIATTLKYAMAWIAIFAVMLVIAGHFT